MPLFLAVAVTDDCIRFKIGNHIIINGFIWGLILISIQAINLFLNNISLINVGYYISSCAEGLLIPFVLLFPIYLVGGIGAGDIKLLCIIGMIITGLEIVRILIILLPVTTIMSIGNIVKCVYLKKHKGWHKIHFSYAIAASWGIYFIWTTSMGY